MFLSLNPDLRWRRIHEISIIEFQEDESRS